MHIRIAEEQDFESIWPIFSEIVSSGESYAYPMDISMEDAKRYWMESPRETYVLSENGSIMGSYYIKTNHAGPGEHVCNCGYMVASTARGMGFATLMCLHSQKRALELGYKAMQFNFVASSNEPAVRLWNRLGYETVGRLPKAFNHPKLGYIDAFVMYKWLDQ